MKRMSILLLMILAVSLTVIPMSIASDNDNRYRDDSSSVFAPGYLNAAKYQAEAIMKQQTPKKSLLDNIVDYMQSKTENTVEKAIAEKTQITPKLQQKQSSNGRGNASRDAAIAAANAVLGTANSAEVPVYIRDGVRASLQDEADRSGVSVLDYEVKASGDKYCAVWEDVDSGNKHSLKSRFFDSYGLALSSGSTTLTSGTTAIEISGSVGNFISTLSNGSLGVFWSERDSGNTYSFKSQFFDSSGNVMSSAPTAFASGINSGAMSFISTISNSSLAVFWYEQNSLDEYSVKSQIFDTSNMSLSSSITTLASGKYDAMILRNLTFENGNSALLWREADAEDNYGLKFQLFNSSGTLLSSTPVTITSGNRGSDLSDIRLLSNERLSVSWLDVDSSDKNTMKLQVFDPTGVAISLAPVTLASNVSADSRITQVSELANGNLALFWQETDENNRYSFKSQVVNPSSMSFYSAAATLASGKYYATLDRVATLADGSLAVSWGEQDSDGKYALKLQVFDSAGIPLSSTPAILASDLLDWCPQSVSISTLSNGNFAVFLRYYDANYGSYIKSEVFDSSGTLLYSSEPNVLANYTALSGWAETVTLSNGNSAYVWGEILNNDQWFIKSQIFDSSGMPLSSGINIVAGNKDFARIDGITALSNGGFAVFWDEDDASHYGNSLMAQVFDPSGTASMPAILTSNTEGAYISDISKLSNGDLAVFWAEYDSGGKYYLKSQVLDSSGNLGSNGLLSPPPPIASLTALGNNLLTNPNINPFNLGLLSASPVFDNDKSQITAFAAERGTLGIFKALLTNNALVQGLSGISNPQLVDRIGQDSFKVSALSVPVKDFNATDMEIATRLSNILKNPTDAQKVTIDSIKALLNDINKVEDASGNSPELAKASDDLLQMVANILLAQAVPDLLKSGDISNIKAMFQELDQTRAKIMLDYAQSTKPYYENILKDLAKNMAMLQAKNLLNPNMTKEELTKLPPSELDKILEKIRSMKDKAFEEEYILQQEAKYRKDYLDPNKKKLEDDMKSMLKTFTGRISDVLKSAEKK